MRGLTSSFQPTGRRSRRRSVERRLRATQEAGSATTPAVPARLARGLANGETKAACARRLRTAARSSLTAGQETGTRTVALAAAAAASASGESLGRYLA